MCSISFFVISTDLVQKWVWVANALILVPLSNPHLLPDKSFLPLYQILPPPQDRTPLSS